MRCGRCSPVERCRGVVIMSNGRFLELLRRYWRISSFYRPLRSIDVSREASGRMDDTQRLQTDDEDEEVSLGNRDRPVGNLHMFAGIHGPAQDFPIYHGQNLIGRHASCDITLPAQSVSKKHAILEVKAGCHTICDNDSLNKTRRGKAALTPNVHYALSDGDFLLFADVACRYSIEKKVEEASTIEDSEDDSLLVPGTQGALAIEKTPGVAIRRMVRGAVLAMDSGDEDEEGEVKRRLNERGHGFGSLKDSNKSSGFGAIFSPITDTFVPESDEENESSVSESHLPSLNLRCDSDTDTHETPTKGSFLTPSSMNIISPPSIKEQPKDDSRGVELAAKEEKKGAVQTDKPITVTLSTDVGSDVKDDQEREQKAKVVLDRNLSDDDDDDDDGGNIQVVVTPDTSSAKSKEDANLNNDQNDREETVNDNTTKQDQVNKSTSVPCVEVDEDASVRINVVQKVSNEMNPANNVSTEESNIKLANPDLKTRIDADISIDSDTDVDQEEDTTASRSGVEETETLQAKPDQDQLTDDAATSGSELETAKTLQGNPDSHIDEEAVKAANADQNQSDSVDDHHDSDTDVEDDLKMLKSETENVDASISDQNKTLVTKESGRLEIDSDSDVENTTDVAEPEEKNTKQDPRGSNEEETEGFHLDSDTDVEEDVSTAEGKKDECATSITVKERKDKLLLDSDTDMDEDVDDSSPLLTKEERDCKTKSMNVQETKDDFHLDSDTDVDEDDPIPGASNTPLENGQTSQIHTDALEKAGMAKSDGLKDERVVPNKEVSELHVDDDTDEDDALTDASIVEEARTTKETTEGEMDVTTSGAAAFHLDSDTDVEEDLGLEKVQASEGSLSGGVTEGHETGKELVSTSSDDAAVSDGLKVETSSILAEDTAEEEESQKSDSENANYELMATQCYLEPQEQESELPDEEEATQVYLFSSTWAEPDPFKRPADPISVLQISAVTLNSSEEEIDETAIAETQAYISEADSPTRCLVQEKPEIGDDSVCEQETTQPADRVEEASEEVQTSTCGTVSQGDTQPVSQYLSDKPPQETGYWLHLKRDVPASDWVRGVQHEEAAACNLKEDQDDEGEKMNEGDKVPTMELKDSPPSTLGVPAIQEQPAEALPEDMPSAEKVGTEPGASAEKVDTEPGLSAEKVGTEPVASALPPTEIEATQPCNQETQGAGDRVTQALGVPDCSETQTSSSHVQEDGDVQPPEINVGITESDNPQPCSSVSAQVRQDDAKETSNRGKGKLPARRGLSRSRKRGESVKESQTAAEIVDNPEELVPDSLPEERSQCNDAVPKQSAMETKEELKAEKGGRRKGTRRVAALDVEEKTETKEEAVSTVTRKRTSKMASEAEPSTTGVSEKVKRKKMTGKSFVKATKEDLEDECKEESAPITEESKEMIEIQASEVDKDNVAKHDSENIEDQGKEDKVSADTIESEDPVISDATSYKPLSESSSDLPNKKRTYTRRRGATEQKKVDNVEAESKDDGDKMTNETINDHKSSVVQDEGHQEGLKKPTSRILVADEDGLGNIESVEQKKEQGEDNTASLTEQKEEPSLEMESSRRLRRSLKEEFIAESEQMQQAERAMPRKSVSTRGGAKKIEDQKGKGNSEDSSLSHTTQRRTKRLKEEAAKPEVANVEKIEEDDPVKKSRRTRKNLKDEQKAENDNEGTDDSKTGEAQISSRTKRESGEEESVAKRGAVKETRRSLRNSKDEDVTNLEDQSKKPARPRKGSKEEVSTEQKDKETSAETHKEDSKKTEVSKRTTLRTRGNLKVEGEHELKVKQTKSNSKTERCSPRTRRKALTEETEEVPEESERAEEPVEKAEERQDVEEKTKLSAGKSRRSAAKEEIPQVSTPVAAKKRGQTSIPEVEVKRKKSDSGEEVKEEIGVVETPPSKRGRPRKLRVDADTAQIGSADGKGISPPEPSPSRSTRQRPSSASSNPPDVRTPRRTNRTSTLVGASSPYVPHSGLSPKVLFTGVVDATGEEVIRTLGGEIADSVFDCTHLVTDRVRRTVKFLCALARGIPIVTLDWIEKCKKSRCFLSPAGFLVHDKEQEKNFNFVLAESLQKAKRGPLFEGYDIHITPSVKPEPEHMKEILRCSGATFLPKAPRTFKEKCVVVSCPEDTARCKSVPSSVPITTAEFILSGILRQEVNPAAYLLNPAAAESAKPTPAKRRR